MQGVAQTVVALDVAQLVDEREQQRQTDDDAEHREDGEKDVDTDVAIELNHEPPPAARDASSFAA